MRYSNTALRELKKRYKNILIKCALINTVALLTFAIPAMADIGNNEYVTSNTKKEITVNTSDISFFQENVTNREDNQSFGGYVFVDRGSSLTVKDSSFSNITFDGNGTIFATRTPKDNLVATLDVSNSIFNNNHTTGDGGAIANYSELTISNSVFTNNTSHLEQNKNGQYTLAIGSDTPIGGGAIALGSVSATKIASISNTLFTENISGLNGGAIGTRLGAHGYNKEATLDIEASFTKNKAYQNGGAFYNTFYTNNNLEKGNGVTVKGNFISNEAGLNGGAIYNDGSIDNSGKGEPGGVMTITNSIFMSNKAGHLGGALYNTGIITFNGTNIFSKNTDRTGFNDIHNIGTLSFNGAVTLDGGISGNGIITFENNSSLTATLQTTTILADTVAFKGNNSFNLTVANGLADADYDFITATTLSGLEHVKIIDNVAYNLILTEEGKIRVSVKSGTEIAKNIDVPITTQEANTLSAIISSNLNSTEKGNLLASAISEALQTGNASAAVEAAKTAAPTTAQVVTGIAKEASSTVSRISTNRMDSLKGRSGGDILHKAGLWMQGLYNHTKQDATTSSDGFKANSRGLALGVDKELTEETTVGIGYGYMKTDADSYGRDMNVDGHNFFLYGKYQPSQWYISSVLNYNYSKYTEKKYPLGIQLRSEYNVNSYGAELMSGYDLDNGLTPEMGFRYLLIDADSYDDGMQRVRSKRDDVLTAVAGIKYATRLKSKGILFKPSVKLAATYDVVSDNSSANILVSGGNSYNVDGSRLHRFGVEAGAGVTASLGNIDLTVEYNGAFRQDYKSQGGMIRARYNF